jgi:hypothetical protein
MRLKTIKVMKIKEELQKGNIKFTIKDITTTDYSKDSGEFSKIPKVFKVCEDAGAINVVGYGIDGMNVTKWGPTCVTLYTFNMLGKKSVGKIKYEDITILK